MAKIMVVDDAKVMRINLRNMLQKLGHEIIAEADSGYSAVVKYKEYEPELVTMDITMPFETHANDFDQIKDGIDAVKKIRLEYPNAKIVMVTSHGEQDKVIRAIQAGASNYILKPINVEKLDEVLKKLL